jgi:hypothetical protein
MRSGAELLPDVSVISPETTNGRNIMRSVLLWAIGIPLPIILVLWLVTGHA